MTRNFTPIRLATAVCLALMLAAAASPLPANAQTGPQPRDTFFDHIKESWAFGEVGVLAPTKYDGGKLTTWPGRIVELIHARYGKPRSILLVLETDPAEPLPVEPGENFIAPIEVIARTLYWRHNLPATPRHSVIGGARYIFSGDAKEEAARVGKAYAATVGQDMPDRKLNQTDVVAGALTSKVDRIAEDAVRYLSKRRLTHVGKEARKLMPAYAASDAPVEHRKEIILAIGRAGITEAVETLQKLAKEEPAVAAEALDALTKLGKPQGTEDLIDMTRKGDSDLAVWAAAQLGARVGDDDAAKGRFDELLASDAPQAVRTAAAAAAGHAKAERALPSLAQALGRGDGASRAAASSLGRLASDDAVEALKKAVTEAPKEGQVGAVIAIGAIRPRCRGCFAFLQAQSTEHPDPAVKEVIASVLDLQGKKKKR